MKIRLRLIFVSGLQLPVHAGVHLAAGELSQLTPHGTSLLMRARVSAIPAHVCKLVVGKLKQVHASSLLFSSRNAAAATAGTCPLPMARSLSTLRATPSATLMIPLSQLPLSHASVQSDDALRDTLRRAFEYSAECCPECCHLCDVRAASMTRHRLRKQSS